MRTNLNPANVHLNLGIIRQQRNTFWLNYFQRSFRTAKSPLRAGHHHGAKGGSFFHRRLSTKSPNRGTCLSTTEIHLEERRSSNIETSTSSSTEGSHTKSPEMSKVKTANCQPSVLPRSTSQPQRVNTTTPPSSCDAVSASAPTPTRGRNRRSQLGQSLSVDNDHPTSPTKVSLPPPEIIISGRDEHPVACRDDDPLFQHRKGSASSEGSCGGRKSPRERLVQKMTRVFK